MLFSANILTVKGAGRYYPTLSYAICKCDKSCEKCMIKDENSQDVKNVVNYHVAQSSLIKKTVQTFDINKSDPDVAVFINNIKDLKL